MLKLTNKQQGFTIVELLIVIVVIGILAAITIVAYNNVNDKARASSAVSALDQAKKKLELYKAENGGYPTDLATIGIENSPSVAYEYTNSASTDYCLTATVSNISYYLNNSTKTSPTEGGCNNHTWPGGVAMTNLVTNGDFSQGTSGWFGYDSTISTSGGIMNNIVNTTPGYSNGFIYRNDFTIIANHIHYYAAKMRVTNSVAQSLVITLQDDYIAQVNSPTINQWYTLSGLKMHTSDRQYMAYRIRHRYVDKPTAANKIMQVERALVIDLTAAFGAGKEPTKAQMDQIMEQFPNSWFNGTVTANTNGIL